MKYQFLADKMKISGPLSGGSYKVTLYTGEYEKDNVAELFKVPSMTVLKVNIETDERKYE